MRHARSVTFAAFNVALAAALAGCTRGVSTGSSPSPSSSSLAQSLPGIISADGDFVAGPMASASATPVQPGEYTTAGKAGAHACRYEVYRAAGSLAKGGVAFADPVSVRLDPGMRLHTAGCQPWRWQQP